MKIAYILNSSEVGGMEIHTLYLAREMVKRGYQVWVICPPGQLVDKFQESGALVIIDQPKYDLDLHYILRLKKYLQDNKIEVAHCHELKAVVNGLIGAWLAHVPKRIAHIHSPLPKWQIPVVKKIGDIAVSSVVTNCLATDVIALNTASRSLRIYGELIRPSLIRVIPNGLELSPFVPRSAGEKIDDHLRLARKYDLPLDSFIVGSLSRLTVEKGLNIAVNAFHEIKKSSPEFYQQVFFLIGGEGVLRDKIQQQIDKNKLGTQVKLIGFIDEKSKPQFLRGLDLFLFPTLHEGFGYVLIEAMASQTPTLSSDIPVLTELTEQGIYGSHFKTRSAKNLAVKIEDIKDNPPATEQLKKAQAMVCERYNLDLFAERYEHLYRKANR